MSNIQRATYAPSVSTSYFNIATLPANKHRNGCWPDDLIPSDLNFLEQQNPLFHHNTILLSPGQYLGHEEVLDRLNLALLKNTTILGDSLGYQFIDRPDIWQGDYTLDQVLDFQEEYTPIATIVDFPSRMVTKGYAGFSSVADLKEITKENTRYFLKRRDPTRVAHLNVVQGQNPLQAQAWYDDVKQFQLEGWAFGGYCRLDFHFLLKLILLMRDDQILEKAVHFHFLGTGTLSSALALTLLKRGIDNIQSEPLPVTYDTSTPFRQAMQNFQIAGIPKIVPNAFTMPLYKAPRDRVYFRDAKPLPYQTSAIAKRLSIGDLCIRDRNIQSHAWDTLSGALVANHNLETMLNGVSAAHGLLDLAPPPDAAQHIPEWLLNLQEVIPAILSGENAGALLSKYKYELQALTASGEEDEQDYEV